MAANGIDGTPTGNPSVNIDKDPFASQRDNHDPFGGDKLESIAGSNDMALSSSPPAGENRRESREWDASKVPPSQFQRRKGSIYSTPSSRDGHVKGSSRDQAYWEKLKEKGWSTSSK